MRLLIRFYFTILICFFIIAAMFSGGCAQVGVPTGGPRDTLAPKLIHSSPAYGSRNVSGNKITLDFDEYIDVQDLQQNLIISPLQNRNPSIIANPRSITLKFRDTLLPNTTYTINFGDAVRDINENNIYHGLTYTFSTGNNLDSLGLEGNVFLAETGSADSTMLVLLYRNANDSSVQKRKPDYIARVRSNGSFRFVNLPDVPFRIYALKDGDGGKTYNSLSEIFAFENEEVIPGKTTDINLLAYTEKKAPETRTTPPAARNAAPDKKLRVSTNAVPSLDLLHPLEISFNNPLKEIDTNKIKLTDSSFRKISGTSFSTDSTAKKISINAKWAPEMPMILVVEKEAVKDSAGTTIAKSDTVRFITKRLEDYGKLILHFSNLDLNRNPVLEFLSGTEIKYTYPLTSPNWSNSLFPPGDFGIRILYDTDKNGIWSPGSYSKKLQPEITVTLPQTLSVRADWDNEREISL